MIIRDFRHSAAHRPKDKQAADLLFDIAWKVTGYRIIMEGRRRNQKPGEYLMRHCSDEERALLKHLKSATHDEQVATLIAYERRVGHPDNKEGGELITRPTTVYNFEKKNGYQNTYRQQGEKKPPGKF